MVIWSTPAKVDLKHIYDFIANGSKHYAKQVVQDIKTKANTLASLPHIGKVIPEMSEETLREIHIYSYRVMYEVRGSDCYILAVIHKRQDFSADDLP